ncbi:MAG: flagellar type III secretion system protein FlhB [Rhodomicrobium sp.]
MSEQPETDNQTEEATEKRKSETLEREGGPVSREVSSAATLMAVAIFLAAAGPGVAGGLARQLAVFIEDPGRWRIDNGADAFLILRAAGVMVSGVLGEFLAFICIAALAASLAQNRPRFVFSRVAPDFSRLSLSAGLNRLFSAQSLVELLKGLTKIAVMGFAALAGLGGLATGFLAIHSTPDAAGELIWRLASRIFLLCAIMASSIAAADLFVSRRNWHRRIRMSKQEIKEELKQAEGNTMLKARLRSIARARIKRRMMLNVPKATLVIANPVHYAVALRYVRGEDTAPRVLAKGQDLIAVKIREIAEKHDIPIIEDKTLAKALFDATNINQLIPQEFYKAVAELIIYISSKSRPSPRSRGKTLPGTSGKPSSGR